MVETTKLGKIHPLVVLLLIIITFGIYIPIWYIRTWPVLERLETPTKPARGLPYALLCLNFVGLVLASGTEVLTPSVLTESGSIRHLDFLISAIYLLLNWFMAVKVVDILYEYSRGSLTSSRVASWLRACFLSIIYLQYEINRLPGPVQGMRSDEEIAERTCS